MISPSLPLLVLAWDDADPAGHPAGAPPVLPVVQQLAARHRLLAVLPQLPAGTTAAGADEATPSADGHLADGPVVAAVADIPAPRQPAAAPAAAPAPTPTGAFAPALLPPAAPGDNPAQVLGLADVPVADWQPAALKTEHTPAADSMAQLLGLSGFRADALPEAGGAGTAGAAAVSLRPGPAQRPEKVRLVPAAPYLGSTAPATGPGLTVEARAENPAAGAGLAAAVAQEAPAAARGAGQTPEAIGGQLAAEHSVKNQLTDPQPAEGLGLALAEAAPETPVPAAAPELAAFDSSTARVENPRSAAVALEAFSPGTLTARVENPRNAAEPGPAEAADLDAPEDDLALEPAEPVRSAASHYVEPARASLTQALAALRRPDDPAPAVPSAAFGLSEALHYRVIQYARFATQALREPADDYGVIYAPSWPTWLAALELRYRLRRPLVLHLSALAATDAAPAERGWLLELERYALRRAHSVLTATEALRQQVLARYALPPERVLVVAPDDAAAIEAYLDQLGVPLGGGAPPIEARLEPGTEVS